METTTITVYVIWDKVSQTYIMNKRGWSSHRSFGGPKAARLYKSKRAALAEYDRLTDMPEHSGRVLQVMSYDLAFTNGREL